MRLAVAVATSALSLGLLYALFGTGLGLVLRASGTLNLAHGDALLLATYAGLGTTLLGGDAGTVLVACVVASAVGVVAFVAVFNPLARRRQGVLGADGFLPALGVALVVRNAAQLLDPAGSRPSPSLFPGGATRLFTGYEVPGTAWWILALGLAVPAVLSIALRRSRAGRQLVLVSADATLARLCGVRVALVLAGSYAVAGLTGGLAGALYASLFGVVATTLGWQATLAGFVAAVLGGAGRMGGVVAGGLALGVVQSVVAGYISATYAPAVVFALVIAVLLVAPEGLMTRARLRQV